MRLLMVLMISAMIMAAGVASAAEEDHAAIREAAQKLYHEGNYKDALDGFMRLCLEVPNDPRMVGSDLTQAWSCLQQLNRISELDDFREKVIARHKDNWRLLHAAARSYADDNHWGYLIAGEFERGGHRGGGEYVNALRRDRVRALQLMQQAMAAVQDDPAAGEVADFHLDLARMLSQIGGRTQAWRLQDLTDLATLPDYEAGYGHEYGNGPSGSPVDAEGMPVFHELPVSWEAAASDGERWRWALDQAAMREPALRSRVIFTYASFLHQQFGVQTVAQYGAFFGRGGPVSGDESETTTAGAYAVHTLTDSETIAKLATGVGRFHLPAAHNYIRLFEEVARLPDQGYADDALAALARIYENRRQYDRAVPYWKKYGSYNRREADQHIAQIVDNWGRFESGGVQPAGRRPAIEYRYRNGRRVGFEAYRIEVGRLLGDIKEYLRSQPRRLDHDRVTPDNIGWRLVQDNQRRYLGEKVAAWQLDLDPDERHWDRRVSVSLPKALEKSGAYLLVADMQNGNAARIIVWVSDTVIVRKPLENQALYYVADAVSGRPLANLPVEFFGYDTRQIQGSNRFRIRHTTFARRSDSDGLILVDPEDMPRNRNWLVTAASADGRLAYLGFTGVWYPRQHDLAYRAVKTFVMTDRPVYRPDQSVHFKLWVRQAKYDMQDSSNFAGERFQVDIHNPKNERVYSRTLTADDFGGLEGEMRLPADAALGVYRISHSRGGEFGGQTFRVEEYKKPEFEVKIEAPAAPVMLGEKIAAVIRADYYFGSPVTEGTVAYKVLRSEHDSRWYPSHYWDWFYGPGYWWYGYDYPWYPGWDMWGCRRPLWDWWPAAPRPQPEVVAEGQTRIQPDGTVRVTIDTGLAKLIHGDSDHRYTIQAEVRDLSRRAITARGEVLVARQPFKVYAWVDRGHYRVGDTVKASFKAQTLDSQPVSGRGELSLYRVTYKDGLPQETPVRTWALDADARGEASLQIQASRAGQYRLSYTLTDAAGHRIEGGYLFNVRGAGEDGAEFRFAKIELIADKSEYAPGDTVRLLINTDRAGAAVLLFVRPSDGVYLPPRVLKIEGKSTEQQIVVSRKDMPNFYVEALCVYDGKLYSEVREIVVPPQQRVLDVALTPSREQYRPGENAKFTLAVTDRNGEPFQGEAVITVYDRALEYISGGANAPEIRAFFWKWRRQHHPQAQSSLARWFHNLLRDNEPPMGPIGVFGELLGEGDSEEGAALADETRADAAGGVRQMAAPAPAAADTAEFKAGKKEMAREAAESESSGKAFPPADAVPLATPAVRVNFADSAFWAARIRTDAQGKAEVSFDMPENLTSWKALAWAMGHGTRVGQATAQVVTRKNLILRLQAPRFFVETDEVVLSANVHNYLETAKIVSVRLELEGGCLEVLPETSDTQSVSIAAGGEARVDWRVRVRREGEVVVRMLALTDQESDAMQMNFPVLVHGMMKQVPKSGVIRPEQTAAEITFEVPAERRVAESRLELRYSPTLAGAMVDALPYLVSYPYGCTEQTLNRFLPTIVTHKVLRDMGLNLADIKAERTNLNAQEIGDSRERSEQWRRFPDNPVFDDAAVAEMAAAGVKRLAAMQLSDGGWGWFSGYGERSYPHTTALVVHGLQIARAAGARVPPGMIEAGVRWLAAYQADELERLRLWEKSREDGKSQADNLDAFVYMVLVDENRDQPAMRDFLYRDRNHLAVYAKAMLGVALHQVEDRGRLEMILRNIEQYLVEDDENQTAYLNLPNGGYWWYWYGSEYEAHGYYLKLLARTDPAGRRASRLVKYLLNNRKHATYWNSTRDTAVIVEAFGEYIAASGEAEPDLTLEIIYDGRPLKTVTIGRQNLFAFDNRLVIAGADITTGAHTVTLRKKGRGPIYFNAYLDYFTLEDFIGREGLELKVQRRVFRLKEVDKTVADAGSRGQVVGKKVEKFERELLENLSAVKSGELVEVELVIESKNDYEYLVFEDMKAAGFEPVEVQSGYTANALGAYAEFRDQKVCFFVRQLARGRHSVSYRLRAEIPGRFSALPARAYAMYAPELKANSDEIKLEVGDE